MVWSDERASELLAAGPDAMIIVDDGGQVLEINSQAESLFGYAHGDVAERPADVLFRYPEDSGRPPWASPGPQPPGAQPPSAQLPTAVFYLEGRRRDGSTFPAEVQVVRSDGRV